MINIKYKIVALAAATSFMFIGCETIQKTSSAIGSTGTGLLAGAVVGTGAGVACDQLTGGKNSVACIAAGMVVGAAIGTLAASLDEEAEKAVPAMDCASIKRRMNYPSTATKPKALLHITNQSLVVKPGEKLQFPLKMDLATPGAEGKEQEVALKFDTTSGTEHLSGRSITKACGGDYPIPLTQPTEKEGVYNTTIKLLNASDNTVIEGGIVTFCYTVANDGINKCGTASSQSQSQMSDENAKKPLVKKAKIRKSRK
jgi:hypothetical protein